MRRLPRSLSARLLAISVLTTALALAFATVGIGHVLERFVIGGLDQQLDAEIAMLARAVRRDGTLDQARIVNLPVFERAGQGWGWRVESARGRWIGGDAILLERWPELPRHPPPDYRVERPNMLPGEARTEEGEAIHTRALRVPTGGGDAVIVAGGPRRLALAPLREALVPLLGSLAILGIALALAAVVQLRYGLRPLRVLQAALAEVRAGRARHVPLDQPRELAPLVAELNALVDQNEAQLAHARRHVANLAHGLKTPLAALDMQLAEHGCDPDGNLRATVADLDRRIRHHLGRARAASAGDGQRARTALKPAVDGLTAVMNGIHADRAITVNGGIAPGLMIAADPQDLDEILGNLLDNAWRHARSTVRIEAAPVGRHTRLTIEDDGPGLSQQASAEALIPGRRLDESGGGYGFGLPIAQELAELNGGDLVLERSQLGGLCVVLRLPSTSIDPRRLPQPDLHGAGTNECVRASPRPALALTDRSRSCCHR